MKRIEYFKELDGLRALAVLGVIGAHLGVKQLGGGFVGVDVFFVISGYLITALLCAEFDATGDIKLRAFFWRRICRLLPAVLAVATLTVLAGYLLLSQEQFVAMAMSAISAIFSVSNIYFWLSVGYFDASAITKPLLHTWSLGVEEQFYVFWPLLLLLFLKLGRSKSVAIGVSTLALLSFLLNAAFLGFDAGKHFAPEQGFFSNVADGAATAFYWFPFRIFEFALGALLVVFPANNRQERHLRKHVWGADALVLLGLAVIICYMVFLSDEAPFPYYNALIVSLATCLIIFAAGASRLAKALLGNTVFRHLGKISYSLYLVHWPLIVYFMNLGGSLESWQVKFSMFIAMLVLAQLLYSLVENPFRHLDMLKKPPQGVRHYLGRAALPLSIPMLAIVILMLAENDNRVPDSRKTISNQEWRSTRQKLYCQDKLEGFPEALFPCQKDRKSARTIVIWGDSHGLHLVGGIVETFPDHNVAVAFMSGCIPQSGFNQYVRDMGRNDLTEKCIQRNEQFLAWAKNQKQQRVIFISAAKRATPNIIAPINNALVTQLGEMGHAPYVLGDFIRPGVELAQCRAVPDVVLSDQLLVDICSADSRQVESELAYNAALESMVERYIPVRQSQCPNDRCSFLDDEGRVTHRDYHHLSYIGAIHEMSKLRQSIIERVPELNVNLARN